MLEERTQDLDNGLEGVVGKFDVVQLNAVRSIPSNILELAEDQVGTLNRDPVARSAALSAEQIQSPSVGSVCLL